MRWFQPPLMRQSKNQFVTVTHIPLDIIWKIWYIWHMTNETVSTKEAAEMIGVSDQTIINWWKDGDIEGYKVNPSKSNSPIRISKKRVQQILAERKNPHSQPAGKQ